MSDDIVDDLHKFTEDTDPFATVPRRLIRNAADEIGRLRAGITQAVEELVDHRQDPATEGMKHGMCVLCGAADGQWPCVTAMVRADLARLLTEDNQT